MFCKQCTCALIPSPVIGCAISYVNYGNKVGQQAASSKQFFLAGNTLDVHLRKLAGSHCFMMDRLQQLDKKERDRKSFLLYIRSTIIDLRNSNSTNHHLLNLLYFHRDSFIAEIVEIEKEKRKIKNPDFYYY